MWQIWRPSSNSTNVCRTLNIGWCSVEFCILRILYTKMRRYRFDENDDAMNAKQPEIECVRDVVLDNFKGRQKEKHNMRLHRLRCVDCLSVSIYIRYHFRDSCDTKEQAPSEIVHRTCTAHNSYIFCSVSIWKLKHRIEIFSRRFSEQSVYIWSLYAAQHSSLVCI